MVSLYTDVGEYAFVQPVFRLKMLKLWCKSKSVRLAVDVVNFGKLGLNSGSYRPFKIVLVCLEVPFDFLIDWCLIFEL